MQASAAGVLGRMRNAAASGNGSWKKAARPIQVILLVSIAVVPLFVLHLRDQSRHLSLRDSVLASAPVTPAAQDLSGPGRQPVSWHRCTSNLASKWNRELVPRSRACHFRNVCISKASGNIQYYVEKGAGGGSLEEDLAREFPPSLVEDYWMEWKHILFWPDTKGIVVGVDVKYEAMPEGAVYVNQSTVVYGDPHFPGNFGHDIGDLMLPIYRLLRLYNLLTRDLLVVFQNRDCRDYEPNTGGVCALHEKLGPWLTDHPFVKLNNSGVQGSDLVCAENVVLGMAHFMMSYGPDIDGMFDKLVEHAMARYGVGPRDHPKEQRIVVFLKNGKRRLLDPEGIAERLRGSFNNPGPFSAPSPPAVTVSNEYPYSADRAPPTPGGPLSITRTGGRRSLAVVLVPVAAAWRSG
ncbi:hypothetical protein KFL_000330200 [Klebsormidium nitens]|uniref:Uncharacterized protein n=1 Tax=Klebsormidium nitens TaxID=105231 RepID=A0A1Y1HLU0_KLENI|nr:hypothetical protein KFL_000330200 [Klebsormidium nitens]|eukprot:GAQ79574.1 hypothetical protein KFL_000330200 [Klebsormidium nitens]